MDKKVETYPRPAHLNILYWNLSNKVVDRQLLLFEHELSKLASLQLVSGDPFSMAIENFRLLLIFAASLDSESFLKWLKSLIDRVEGSPVVWLPAVICFPHEGDLLIQSLNLSIASNWHFDIVHPNHIGSLPMRVANLIRTMEHLEELKRYQMEVELLENDIRQIQAALPKVEN